MRLHLARLLVSAAVGLVVALSGYASALTFSTVTDSDLRCDTDGVVIAGWGYLPTTQTVQSVSLTGISPTCEDAELYVLVRRDGATIADGAITVSAGQTGTNAATIALTAPGTSNATVTLNATDIEEASVLLHRGSEVASGVAESPCEFIGASIDGWDVDPLTAQVSGVRLRGISTACIGNEVLVELFAGGSVVRDGSFILTAGNTGANVVTVPVTAPGNSTALLPVAASVPTSIQISVIGEDPVTPQQPGNGNNGNGSNDANNPDNGDGANGGDGNTGQPNASQNGPLVSETLGAQSVGPQSNSPAAQAPVNEVLGTRDEPTRLPSTGSYLPSAPAVAGVPGPVVSLMLGVLAVAAGLFIWCLPVWRRRHRDEV